MAVVMMVKRIHSIDNEYDYTTMTTEPSQADIMAALQAGAFRSKPVATSTYADFSDPSALITTPEGSTSNTKTNSRKIYCFREGCGSVILQPKASTYLESTSTIVSHHNQYIRLTRY
jgi:hypothetical protein